MRKLAVVLLLALLAVGAWWTAYPRTAPQAVGWCVEQRGQEVRLKDCGEPPLTRECPPETDDAVRAPLPPRRQAVLCLDTKPGAGNTRT
jgi:hypothetical protein